MYKVIRVLVHTHAAQGYLDRFNFITAFFTCGQYVDMDRFNSEMNQAGAAARAQEAIARANAQIFRRATNRQ